MTPYLEVVMPAWRAGLHAWSCKTFVEARQAVQESLLLMGRRDKRTWRGKVRSLLLDRNSMSLKKPLVTLTA